MTPIQKVELALKKTLFDLYRENCVIQNSKQAKFNNKEITNLENHIIIFYNSKYWLGFDKGFLSSLIERSMGASSYQQNEDISFSRIDLLSINHFLKKFSLFLGFDLFELGPYECLKDEKDRSITIPEMMNVSFDVVHIHYKISNHFSEFYFGVHSFDLLP